jgi:hypothetical protein
MTRPHRPGSVEGCGEIRHWSYENGPVKKSQREFLCAEARRRITDPIKRAEVIRWINRGRTTTAQARQLCTRWGIELPDGTSVEGVAG